MGSSRPNSERNTDQEGGLWRLGPLVSARHSPALRTISLLVRPLLVTPTAFSNDKKTGRA